MTNETATSQQAADAMLLAARPAQGCWSESDYLWLTDRFQVPVSEAFDAAPPLATKEST